MNAVRGALGLLMIEAMIYLIPPDRDPAFLALPVSMRGFMLIALGLTFIGGAAMFLWGVVDEYNAKHPHNETKG